jgi:fructokinase
VVDRLFDVDGRLRGWLLGALAGRRLVSARRLAGGYRNDNLLLTTADGTHAVLRRYRHENRCAVEAALARRVAGVVPVAEVIAADPDGAAAGEPVLLSRFVPGVLASAALRDARGADAEDLGRATGAALAAIGGVSFARPGFFDGPDLVPGPPGFEPTTDLPAFVRRCLAATGPGPGTDEPATDRPGTDEPGTDRPGTDEPGTDWPGRGLDGPERAALLRLADHLAGFLPAVHGARQLVHGDFNPKNLLVRRGAGTGWAVAAVLDWEFAHSSTPLTDVGNMLRFSDEHPPGFGAGFVAGFRAHGGQLPAQWREISRAVDLYALADLMTRPGQHPYVARARDRIRRQLGPPAGGPHREAA